MKIPMNKEDSQEELKKKIIYVYCKRHTYPKPVSFPYILKKKHVKQNGTFSPSLNKKRNFKYFLSYSVSVKQDEQDKI